MLEIGITFLVALIGGVIAVRCKVPAGAMVGAMIAVAVFNVATGTAYFPTNAKIMTQIVSGLFIGCKITRREVLSLKRALKPAVMNVVLILCACLVMGVVLYFFTDYSLATCTFASAPGSLVDMAIISIDMGADTSVVSVLQLVRLLSILGLFPTLFGLLIKRIQKKHPEALQKEAPQQVETAEARDVKHAKNIAITLLVAIACGLIGHFVGIPAGALIASMIGVSLMNIFTGAAYMPFRMKQFAQVCAGALIGESVNREAIVNLRGALLPAAIMLVCLFLIVLILSFILYKTSDLDFVTALFSCAPGGASDLALIAEDFGANTPKVSIIQTMRVVCVIIFYPPAIQLIAHILS